MVSCICSQLSMPQTMTKLNACLSNLCKEIKGTMFLRWSSKFDLFAETILSEWMSRLCDNILLVTDKVNSPGHCIQRYQNGSMTSVCVLISEIFHSSYLTYQNWCRIWQVSVNSTTIGFGNCSSPLRHQAIIWANAIIIMTVGNFSLKFDYK